jgi:hypothetical protein
MPTYDDNENSAWKMLKSSCGGVFNPDKAKSFVRRERKAGGLLE